jgi:hypothetical protein
VNLATLKKLVSQGKVPSGYDQNIGSRLYDIVSGDNASQTWCTKPYNKKDGDLPGFYVTSKYLQNIDSALEGTCKHDSPPVVYHACNDFTKVVHCSGTYKVDSTANPIVEYCKESKPGGETGYREVKITQNPLKFSADEPYMQGEGARQCNEILDTNLTKIWSQPVEEATGAERRCAGASAGGAGLCSHRSCHLIRPDFTTRHNDSKKKIDR